MRCASLPETQSTPISDRIPYGMSWTDCSYIYCINVLMKYHFQAGHKNFLSWAPFLLLFARINGNGTCHITETKSVVRDLHRSSKTKHTKRKKSFFIVPGMGRGRKSFYIHMCYSHTSLVGPASISLIISISLCPLFGIVFLVFVYNFSGHKKTIWVCAVYFRRKGSVV